MNLSVAFLGTGAARPTPERNTSASVIVCGSDRTLLDCGEGTQRQLVWSRFDGIEDIDRILISHLHQDHSIGLPSLLGTFASRKRTKPLTVYGPPGTFTAVKAMLVFAPPIRTFDFKIVELEGGEQLWSGPEGFTLSCFRTQHTIFSLGWMFQEPARPGKFDAAEALRRGVPSGPLMGALQRGETVTLADGTTVSPEGLSGRAQPGRKLVLTSDTEQSLVVLEAALGADLLVTEATFLRGEEQEARFSKHTVSYEAGRLAAAAKVRSLALTHISSRYPAEQAAQEARELFGEVCVPADFDEIEIPYPEKGLPRLISAGARNVRAAAPPAVLTAVG